MNEELRKAIADYFDPGEFAEFIGVTVEQILDRFEQETEDCLPEILELMNYEQETDDED